MPDDTAGSRASNDVAALRSGRDWAEWLRQAHAAPPSGAPGHQPGESLTAALAALAALVHLTRRHGFAVERGDCGDSEGFASWTGRRIRVRADATPGQAVTALAHQLGHVLLHGQTARLDPGGTIACGGLRQVEADSVAYLTATHLGIDTAAITFPYVSSWAGTDPRARPAATIQAATARILAAVETVIAHLDAELSAGRTPGKPAVTTALRPYGHTTTARLPQPARRFWTGTSSRPTPPPRHSSRPGCPVAGYPVTSQLAASATTSSAAGRLGTLPLRGMH